MKYVKKPSEFDAIFFEGGRESARFVTGWLADRKLHAAWYENIEPSTNHEGITLPGRPEKLVVEFDGLKADVMARPQSWIILGKDSEVTVLNDREFTEQFEKKYPVD